MKQKIIFESSNVAELIVGKDDQKLNDIAEKHFIQLPAKDLAIFKCIFAYIDKENLNGCTLPREEAEKALASLTGKAVDFDHYRRTTVGHWLEASIEDDKIIAYGVFYKGNHEEAYEQLHEIMEKSELGISFEAWGDKTGTDRHYSLSNIEFAGGAMLPTTKPAFPGAKVLEMANEKRKKVEELHKSSFSVYDFDIVMRLVDQAQAPKGEEEFGFFDVAVINFEENFVLADWVPSGNRYKIQLDPTVKKISEKGFIKVVKSSNTDDSVKNDMEVSKKMEEELKELKTQIETLNGSLVAKDEEIASLKKSLDEANAKIEESNAEISTVKSELEESKKERQEAVEKAAKEAKIVAERRAELGDFVKEMTDEDLLDDKNFALAQKDKKITELEAADKKDKTEKASLEAGSKVDEKIVSANKKVQEFAFGSK